LFVHRLNKDIDQSDDGSHIDAHGEAPGLALPKPHSAESQIQNVNEESGTWKNIAVSVSG
jgi:hypothetical protein